ncbi:hypothetical protein DINM_000126 [Dirofilaria immitis]|nr:hypothetical protein [Dirofilaria immitis]
MCVTFVYVEHNPNAKYKLILLNNRDELLNRPTSTARWENDILAGRDEKENVRGTWLCMNSAGRISNLLTITVPIHEMKSSSVTRGILPIDFVKSNKQPEEFCKLLISTVNRYNAFQILCFQRKLFGYTRTAGFKKWNSCDALEFIYLTHGCLVGVVQGWGLRSHRRDPGNEYDQYEIAGLTYQSKDNVEVTKYPPVRRGVEKVSGIVEEINAENLSEAEIIERLLQLATDKYQCFPDDQIKRRCGRSNELCKYRTAIFVRYPDGIPYGTRSHTIIIVDRNNRATYYEKSMETKTGKVSEATWTERTFHFDLI